MLSPPPTPKKIAKKLIGFYQANFFNKFFFYRFLTFLIFFCMADKEKNLSELLIGFKQVGGLISIIFSPDINFGRDPSLNPFLLEMSCAYYTTAHFHLQTQFKHLFSNFELFLRKQRYSKIQYI